MRTITTTSTLYTLAELAESGEHATAFDRAKEIVASMAQPDADSMTEYLEETLRDMVGDDCAVTSWDVSWSQGDGAEFRASFDPRNMTGESVNNMPVFPKDAPALAGVSRVSVAPGSGFYSAMTIELDYVDNPANDDMTYDDWGRRYEAASALVLDWYRDVAAYLYQCARADFEYRWDTEPCIEYAADMGLEFTEAGKLARFAPTGQEA